ncbi:ArnT family glycosyltransferase [Occallatibacter savannae]|uniref:ArnT family glycosyltransferase n=1 Tax=Occallatibacter savannae TaxID=1002691 RepID=UPI0013A566D6|nr:glycosyltransferase family 39 protein [Occallatibacter savannae]
MQTVTAGNRVRNLFSILPALLAGALLRIWMLKHFFEVTGDSLIYGGIAKNLLLSGRYALTVGTGETYPTLIRLPGYPLFLAACFKLFGMENYASAAWVQIVMDLVACLLLADVARRVAPAELKRGAAYCTLWLAALCPFTAVYVANPLTEGPTIFTIALAMWCAVRFDERPGWWPALAFTFAVTYAALLRPDGALVPVAFAPVLLMALVRERRQEWIRKKAARIVPVCVLLAVMPFAAWTWRNWKTFQVFEPLAPRYATDPGEPTQAGWVSWVKTWCLDFVSTYQVYWNVPGDTLDPAKLPKRAFDNPAQYAETAAIANDYNNGGNVLTPELDARFAKLAQERYAAHPLGRHLLLPVARMLDMWVRPRVENLPIDLDWWVYSHHNAETRFSWFYVGLNALYLLVGIVGLWLRPRMWPWMLAYFVLRSLLLMTVEAPEARYTLECFPMLFVLGGVTLYRLTNVVLLSVLKLNASEGRD